MTATASNSFGPGVDTSSGRPRARDLGICLDGTPGFLNAITDVPGVEVGVVTLIEGDGPLVRGEGPVRTGVTAILPRGRNGVGRSCPAGFFSFNGNGEMTGTSWIEETGGLSMPITISNTHAVGACHQGVIEWINQNHPRLAKQWLLPVCAETWDGYLNDINGGHVTANTAIAALDAAASGPVAEGSVGGGTGMNCYNFKGGNGTASRSVNFAGRSYTIGVFLQANFGSRHELTIAGAHVGRELDTPDPMGGDWVSEFTDEPSTPAGAGSTIVVVATDAPLTSAQCKALARRAPIGLGRTGTTGSHFSGDIFLAFSTANEGVLDSGFPPPAESPEEIRSMEVLSWSRIDRFYDAVVQAVEEAVLNALVVNADMTGRDGHWTPALPHGPLQELLNLHPGI